ncbi:YtxH domain-containing protein [Candidatus Saccharibacteria bacterium]|nr:YtxH domain-containing protein [Candidatus Saccharibacteria bacterium]
MSKGKFAVGTLFGAAIGLLAGVLTAPKSGKETRADLKAKAEVMKGDASKKVEKVQMKANKVADDMKDKAAVASQDARARSEDLKERAERAIDGARKGFSGKE